MKNGKKMKMREGQCMMMSGEMMKMPMNKGMMKDTMKM